MPIEITLGWIAACVLMLVALTALYFSLYFKYWNCLSDNASMAVDLTITLVLIAGLIFAMLYQG